jgi:hypothetical protein
MLCNPGYTARAPEVLGAEGEARITTRCWPLIVGESGASVVRWAIRQILGDAAIDRYKPP